MILALWNAWSYLKSLIILSYVLSGDGFTAIEMKVCVSLGDWYDIELLFPAEFEVELAVFFQPVGGLKSKFAAEELGVGVGLAVAVGVGVGDGDGDGDGDGEFSSPRNLNVLIADWICGALLPQAEVKPVPVI